MIFSPDQIMPQNEGCLSIGRRPRSLRRDHFEGQYGEDSGKKTQEEREWAERPQIRSGCRDAGPLNTAMSKSAALSLPCEWARQL